MREGQHGIVKKRHLESEASGSRLASATVELHCVDELVFCVSQFFSICKMTGIMSIAIKHAVTNF